MKGKKISKGLVPPIVTVLFSRTKKSCVLLESVEKIKVFFGYWAGAENKYEYNYWEERFLKTHLSSVECNFIEPNIEDIHADSYLPLVTSRSTKRGLAWKSLLLIFTGYIHWWFIFFICMKTYLVVVFSIFSIDLWNSISFWFTFKFLNRRSTFHKLVIASDNKLINVFQLAAGSFVSSIFNLRNGVHKLCSNEPTGSYSFKHGSLVPQVGSCVSTHGDPWSTWMTNETIDVTFKVASILHRKFPQRMSQP